jgi:hypothetical protein
MIKKVVVKNILMIHFFSLLVIKQLLETLNLCYIIDLSIFQIQWNKLIFIEIYPHLIYLRNQVVCFLV